MVFQQRNGCIDRYGCAKAADSLFALTDSDNPKIKGDNRILEVLIERRPRWQFTADPSEFSQEEGEAINELIERVSSDDDNLDDLINNFFSGVDSSGNAPADLIDAFAPTSNALPLADMLGQRPKIF